MNSVKKCPKCGHPNGLINCKVCHPIRPILRLKLKIWRIW